MSPAAVSREDAVDILVVDDQVEDLAAMRAVLCAPDVNVVTASSGPEALKHLLRQDFAVIVLDVLMPDMDGFELATLIKSRERSQHTPMVFLTADATDAKRLYRAYSVGAIDYLQKPVDPEIIRAKVAVFVDLFRKDRRILDQAKTLRESERRERELQIAELKLAAERRYNNLAEAVPQIVWTCTPAGLIDYSNRHFAEYAGLTPARAKNHGFLDLAHPDDAAKSRAAFESALARGDEFTFHCRLRRHDGVFRWHACRGVPERERDGRIVAWLGVCTDFEELHQAIHARDEFLSIASHELRTPLTALKLRVQGLQRNAKLDSHVRERLDSVGRQTLRLERLISDLLDVSRIATGHLTLDTENFDLLDAAREVIDRMTERAVAQNCEVRLTGEGDAHGTWDRVRIEQVITNLLDNALRHGAGHPVSVQFERREDAVAFAVVDQGNGIAASDLSRIFERFERAEGQRGSDGLGMGLYIARQIVEAHGGKIHAESAPARGAAFHVVLPLAPTPTIASHGA
jgi:PAS domain S-box-containing protein